MRLGFANLHKRLKVDEGLMRSVAAKTAKAVRLKIGSVSVVFISVSAIRSLNRRFRKSDRATDVLCFRTSGAGGGRPKADYGDIFISLDAAKANSKVFGTSFEEEAALYIVHGILHLAGYDDESAKERSRMRKREEKILKEIYPSKNSSKASTPR